MVREEGMVTCDELACPLDGYLCSIYHSNTHRTLHEFVQEAFAHVATDVLR
jgi:hypothetical protein